jgi:asparagine synthase (glutamine-hydrolysing)
VVNGNGNSRRLYVSAEIGTALPDFAQRAGCGVIFEGALYNRLDLQHELGDFTAPAANTDAETILAGYLRWGEELFPRLRGSFALTIWDGEREVLLCLRDPLGHCPLFFARAGGDILVSTSIALLLKQRGVSRALNRPAMADFLIDRFPSNRETFFEAIERIPTSHVLKVKGDRTSVYRYWDPGPDDNVSWIKADELEQFDEFFNRAVRRCLSFGPAAIFLSGGLDSGAVTAMAAEQSEALGLPKPLALSLVFPDPRISEEVVQRSVATQLGLRHVVTPFYEATGENGLIQPALELTKSLSSPLLNTWWPAYMGLAREGVRSGCRVVLTGDGGDEWLTVSPLLAADLLRRFDLAGVYRLWQSIYRSYHEPTFALYRNLMWNCGIKPLLIPPLYRTTKALAPWVITLKHRVRPDIPTWLAPDRELRNELDRRYREPKTLNTKRESFYLQSGRTGLDIPLISMVAEETFNVGQQLGLREFQPFWDVDLVDLLYRTPPFLLNRDGRNKGLVRSTLTRKFPHIGFNEQRKLGATDFYASSIYREAPAALRRIGRLEVLGDLRVTEDAGLRGRLESILTHRPQGRAYQVWKVLNLESWARAHVS